MKFLWKKHVISSFVAVLALFAASFMGIAAVGAADHGQLVEDSPRRNLPIVLDGEVRAHAVIGDRIFVGGDFQQVQRPDGTTITQPNIFAYDINTGLLDENFRPVVDNAVWALEVNPRGDTLYAGGRFVTWDGSVVERVAKLDAFGNRDTSFQASASAIVRGLAATNDDVYLAGDFFFVGDKFHAGFAAVDANTGAVDSGFNMNVENSAATGQLARGIVVTSDGNSVFGLHFGTSINGNSREALVKIDTSGNTAGLADWRVDWSGQTDRRVCLDRLRDIAIAPDDSFIVIGGQGGDIPPNCDSVLRYPTGGTGFIDFDWSARLYSSIFSVAVSDTAVYVGGHFCAAPLNGADPVTRQTHERIDVGDTPAVANQCNRNDPNDPVNPSVIFPNDAVFRKQLAALDPSDGRALAWDPGSNASLGTLDLTTIDRGLLAGMDRDRYGNFIFTGRSGFFDFGGFTPPAPPPPAPVVAACVVEVINDVPVVSYSGFPNVSVVNILRNGSWIANDTSATPGTGTYEDTSAVPDVDYSYVIRSRPGGGVVNDVACSPANAAPVANADTASTLQDTAVTINVTANDSDANGDTLVVDDVTAATNGTAVIVGGNILYTPAGGFLGTDTFSYTINDGNGGEATAAVTVTVTANEPPVAVDDTGSMPQDTTATFDVLSNDSDPENDPLTLTITSPPDAVVGTATVVNGEIQFEPAPGSTATGVIGYTISDGNGGTALATLTVTVTEVTAAMSCSVSVNANNVPVVSYSGFPDVSVVNILRNGSWIATHTSGTPGAGTYEDTSAVPDVDYSYVIRSRPGGGVVNDVACSPANTAPVANADTASTLQDTAVTINVTANDSDANGDTLVLDDVTVASNGTAVIVSGNILYTPAGGFLGTDTFSYTINDGNGGEATAVVTVTVTEVITNEPPVAVDDTGSMPQDTAATFDVLSNDSDPENDPLTLTISSPPDAVVGTATVVNGEIQFVPAPDSTATGVIGYTISDGNGGTASATLTVTVTEVITPAMSCSVSVNANNVPVVSYSGFPNNRPTVNILRNGRWIATHTSGTPGAGTYEDTYAVPGVDYSYVIRSRPGGGVVNDVACSPANTAPVAVDDTGSMEQDSTATFDVLSNDSDPDGDPLTLTISSPPDAVAGTATVVGGEIQFTPAAGSTTTGVIGYTIADGNGGTDTATLTVTVTATNEPPVAVDDTGSMAQDSTATFDVLSNDSDPDGDPLTLTISSPPDAVVGTATVMNGKIQFVPAPGSTATGVIGYTIDDGNGGAATATLTVTVTEI